MPLLIALTEGSDIPLDKPILLIGRHQECDIQIPSRKISRRHCCIAMVADHLVVRDLGSTNGIRINGVKVSQGNLQANDELMIGNFRYQVQWGSEARAPRPATHQLGVKSGDPPVSHTPRHDESYDMPMPLPDVAFSHPAVQALPKSPPPDLDGTHKPGAYDKDDGIGLIPLKPKE